MGTLRFAHPTGGYATNDDAPGMGASWLRSIEPSLHYYTSSYPVIIALMCEVAVWPVVAK